MAQQTMESRDEPNEHQQSRADLRRQNSETSQVELSAPRRLEEKSHQGDLTHPRSTKRSTWQQTGDAVTDILLFLISAAFFVLGVVVFHYHDTRVTDHPLLVSRLQTATTTAPTLFPIIFAAVLGRATKSCLSWRLERGDRVGLLDLLASCTSVVNTAVAQVSLRRFSVAGTILIGLWALSPIASQASIRVMSVGPVTFTNSTSLAYLDVNSSYAEWMFGDPGEPTSIASGLYFSSLLAPTRIKTSSVDTWGNVKIPMVERISGYQASDSTWIDVSDVNVTYTALVGLPTSSLPSDRNGTFTIETSYWTLDCPVLSRGFKHGNLHLKKNRNWSGSWFEGTALLSNSSDAPLLSGSRSPYVPHNLNHTKDQTDLQPRVIVYNAHSPDNRTKFGVAPFSSICTIQTTYVEVEITCTDKTCMASKIRKSLLPHLPSAWTLLDAEHCEVWNFFAENFVQAYYPRSGENYPSMIQGYLLAPDTPVAPPPGKALWQLDKEAYADRLAQLLNTWWIISVGYSAILDEGDVVSTWLGHGNDSNNQIGSNAGLVAASHSTTSALLQSDVDVVQCHIDWLCILLITSTILLVASLVSVLVRAFTRGPALALNVSTLVRDNPYVTAPTGGSALDSSDRSRLLKDLKVKLGDVMPDEDIGHLAVGTMVDGQVVDDVRKGRLYD